MLKVLLLIFAVSIDVFVAAVGLGGAGIKVPLYSAAIISFAGTLCLCFSVCCADIIISFVPSEICRAISSVLLILLGIVNIFYGTLKKAAEKKKLTGKQIEMYFDGTAADRDNSKVLSFKEALALSAALSADALVTGLGAGLSEISLLPMALISFAVGLSAMLLGVFLGKNAVTAKKLHLQKLCGIVLIILAVVN